MNIKWSAAYAELGVASGIVFAVGAGLIVFQEMGWIARMAVTLSLVGAFTTMVLSQIVRATSVIAGEPVPHPRVLGLLIGVGFASGLLLLQGTLIVATESVTLGSVLAIAVLAVIGYLGARIIDEVPDAKAQAATSASLDSPSDPPTDDELSHAEDHAS